MQSSSQIVTVNKPTSSFYRLDALPVTHPTVSKHLREGLLLHFYEVISVEYFAGLYPGYGKKGQISGIRLQG